MTSKKTHLEKRLKLQESLGSKKQQLSRKRLWSRRCRSQFWFQYLINYSYCTKDKCFLWQRQKSLASRSITTQPILLINMQPSPTVWGSKHCNILVLQRKQTFLVRNLSSEASGNLKDVLLSLIRSHKHFMMSSILKWNPTAEKLPNSITKQNSINEF